MMESWEGTNLVVEFDVVVVHEVEEAHELGGVRTWEFLRC